MIAKAAGVVIGVGLISTGGIAMTKPHWLGMDYMPSFHALSKDHDYGDKKSNDYSNDKFGNKYSNYLVGVTNKTKENNDTSSRVWWEWAFRKLQNDGVQEGKFKVTGSNDKKVDRPYGGDNDSTALNQVCKAAYKENNSTGFATGTDNTKFNKSDVWKYCSPLGKEPTKVKENNTEKNKYSNKIGSENGSDFISVDDPSNDMFWLIRDKEVKGSDKDNFEQVLSTDSSNHFKNKGESLKELCRRAYLTDKNPPSGDSNPTKTDAEKYCKFEIPNS